MHKCVISINQSMMTFILFSVTAIIFLFTSQASCSSPFKKILMEKFRKPFAAIAIASSTFLPAFSAYGGTRDVGNMATSGFIFKDTLRISAFEDPKIKGITLYLADFERPITDKLANDFFNEPSSSSLSCAQTGPINRNEVLSSISTDASGEEVFEESRNLFFKQIRVRRVLDKKTNTVIYASYSSKFNKDDDSNKSRFKSSLCAVHLDEKIQN